MTALMTGPPKKRSALRLSWRKDERGNLRRSKRLVAELDAKDFAGLQVVGDAEREELQFFLNVFDAASHEPLDRVDGALGMFRSDYCGRSCRSTG